MSWGLLLVALAVATFIFGAGEEYWRLSRRRLSEQQRKQIEAYSRRYEEWNAKLREIEEKDRKLRKRIEALPYLPEGLPEILPPTRYERELNV